MDYIDQSMISPESEVSVARVLIVLLVAFVSIVFFQFSRKTKNETFLNIFTSSLVISTSLLFVLSGLVALVWLLANTIYGEEGSLLSGDRYHSFFHVAFMVILFYKYKNIKKNEALGYCKIRTEK